MKSYPNLFQNDIFPIPVGDYFGKNAEDLKIMYSPLIDKAMLVTGEYADIMEGILGNPENTDSFEAEVIDAVNDLTDFENRKKPAPLAESPDTYTRMAILPNNVCNFSCSYCYSAHGRSGKVISRDTLKASLDHFIDNTRISNDNKLAISILGGGEPMLSWNLVKFIIEYSNERSQMMGFRGIDINLVTNGSIFNQEMIDVLKKNKVPVSFSFEILESVQNLQRGHYEKVVENIKWLLREGLHPQLRACITLDNIDMMKDMIDEVVNKFQGVREVMMEYVTDPERMTDVMQVRAFYDKYLENFFEAHDYAKENGILLDCSAYRNFNLLIQRFCPGDNTLTAHGEISVCSRIGAPDDAGYSDAIYGKINSDGAIQIDRKKFFHLLNRNVHNSPKCQSCWAKWHCAGGCMVHKYTYNQEIRDEICRFMRNFCKRMIIRNLDKVYKQNYGTSLRELISEL